jgi:hypothetical protein
VTPTVQEDRITRQAQLDDLQVDLEVLDAELDHRQANSLLPDIIYALDRLEALGVTPLMTPSESMAVSTDNLGSVLEDSAGMAALRNGLRLGARIIGMIRTTGLHDWWEGAEPEVLIASDASSPAADLFDEFGDELLTELGIQWNVAAFATPRVRGLDSDRLLPPVSSVVTNNAEYLQWALSWDGRAVWWEDTPTGFRVQLHTTLGAEPAVLFSLDQLTRAVDLVTGWLTQEPQSLDLDEITVSEHRALESVIHLIEIASPELQLSAEDRVRLDVLIQTLQLQLRTPTTDRTIIGQVLHGLAVFGGGVFVGIASTYLTSLMVRFGIPLP